MAFPVDALDVAVEIFYDGVWNDITSYVFDRSTSAISITRGRGNESSRCSPGLLSLELNNSDGRFVTRNALSPLYGKIGRNTLIRVQVTHSAVTYTRFVGEVVSWPPRQDLSGNSKWVPLKAVGILRRLGRGSKPQKSSLFRAMSGAAQGDITPHEYWPLEDGANATQFASAVGGLPGTGAGDWAPTDVPVPAGHSGIPGSSTSVGLPLSARIDLPVRAHADTGQWVVQVAFISDDIGDGEPELRIVLRNGVDITCSIGDGGTGIQSMLLDINDASGSSIFGDIVDVSDGGIAGEPFSLMVACTDTGAGDDFVTRILDGAGTTRLEITTTNIGYSTVRDLRATTGGGVVAQVNVGVSHVTLFTDASFDPDVDSIEGARAASGWLAEPADERFEHLCAQAHIASTVVGSTNALMGRERTTTRIQALRDCEDTDQGFIHETRDDLGLTLRTNASRYNQTPVTLDFDAKHVSPPFEPQPDDLATFNDREVSRYDGSSARAVLEEGPLSIQDPPDGVGLSDDGITVNAYTDEQLGHIASWRLHLGTWDAERYPRVHVNLARNTSLIASVVPLDSGALLEVTNLSDGLPDAALLVEGYTETIRQFAWDIVFNTSPAGPFQVFTLDDDVLGRLASAGASLALGIDADDTSVLVATDPGKALWITTAGRPGDFPFAAWIGGELVTVTAITGTTSPQTFTVTRSVNGVARSWAAGTQVQIATVAVPP